MSFGQLVLAYGGWQWPPAIEAAQRHALRCGAMGGKWLRADETFSGLMLFLKYTMTLEYVNTQCWDQLLEYDENDKREAVKAIDGPEQEPQNDDAAAASSDAPAVPKTKASSAEMEPLTGGAVPPPLDPHSSGG